MKSMNRILTSAAMALLAVVLVFQTPIQAANTTQRIQVVQTNVAFVINEQTIAPAEQLGSFIYNNSTYVPLRFAAYMMEKAVAWDGTTATVTVTEPNKSQLTTIQQYLTNRQIKETKLPAKPVTTSEVANTNSFNYSFFGKSMQPAAGLPGFIINNTMYVPVRFFIQSIGIEIQWDAAANRISATTTTAKPGASGDAAKPSDKPTTSGESTTGSTQPTATTKPTTSGTGGAATGSTKPVNTGGTTTGGNTKDPDAVQPEDDNDEPTDQPSTGTDPEPGGSGGTNEPSGGSGSDNPVTPVTPVTPAPDTPVTPVTPVTPKVTYNKIINDTNKQIDSLQLSCQNKMLIAYGKYNSATTAAARQAAIESGYAAMDACDASFAVIMNTLTTKLTKNGYSTAVVQTYRNDYEAKKASAMAQLIR